MCRDYRFYLVDIFIAYDKIKRYTQKFNNANDLLYSELEWDATIREFEIIGEATNFLLQNNFLDSKHRIIVDFRNKIIHGYFGIDEVIVWDVIQNFLPEFMNELQNIIKKKQIDLTDVIESAKKDFYFNKKIIEFLEDFEYRIKKWKKY